MQIHSLSEHLSHIVAKSLEELGVPQPSFSSLVLVERPSDQTHGHFAVPVAMALFGKLKKESPEILEKLEIANPRQ